MSQPSSPSTPSPDDQPAPPRRLISPQERFAEPSPEPEIERVDAETEPENPFDAQISARRRDEMERRHSPPRERARPARARLKREAPRRTAPSASDPAFDSASDPAREQRMSEQRARAERGEAEREFARTAREVPPVAPRKRRPMPRWLKRLFALAALIFVGELGFAAFTAPQFNVKSVEIQGIGATPHEPLHALARGLIGQNLLRLDSNIARRGAETLPTVASAEVVRLAQWPPKVALRISERQPLLKVGAGSDWWVVDAGGVPFRRANAEDATLYSVVAPQFAPVVRRALPAKMWGRALALGRALEADNRLAARAKSGENARWQLRRVYFDRDGLASLRLSGATHREMLVRLGDDAWPAKLVRARQSLAYFERSGRRASELDLVSLERPVWKQKAPQLVVHNQSLAAENAG